MDTFPKLLLHHSRERGERPAIREKNRGIWRTITWRELGEEAAALAVAASERGLQRGAHVALLGDNRPRLYVAMCAAQWLGAIVVPLYQDATADEIATSIQRAQVTHVFAENQEQVDKLLEILPRCPTVRCIVYDKDRGMRHYKQPQLVSYDALLQEGRELAAQKPDFLQGEVASGKGEDSAFLFFTSGTTGPAKGVVLAYAALIDRARLAAAIGELKDTDVAMAYLPPGWIGQILFGYVQPMVVGYCICCPESPDTMLSDMREMGPTYLLVTPRVLEALLKQVSLRIEETGGFKQWLYRSCMAVGARMSEQRLAGKAVSVGDRVLSLASDLLIRGPLRDMLGMSKVRVAYSASDAIDPDLLMFFRTLGINLKQLYGSTETGFFVAMQRDGVIKPDTVGAPLEGVELKLTPQREILVRSPGLFREYHADSEMTARAKNAEGWFHTGDAGDLDQDGQLRIIDRMAYVGALKDGSPYAPRVIENKLKFLPYIREAVVFGDGRDMVCALIDIEMAAAGRWADRQGVSYIGHADLAAHDEVYALIADCIAKVNAQLASEPLLAQSQIHRFTILGRELSADDGALTRTGKLRRHVIAEQYRALVDAMYSGHAGVRFGAEPDEVKIRDAKVTAPAQTRKVA
ncbi:AMP-dependent synthetase/ligase [Bradyrhizobium jicamae]|uniref:AMP-dependent synthetase/ligase n=1 Tax=Bradyrhizobium jicamae TaxID=280332 RepID=UPI0018DDBB50|nr:AMP-binding protein [Bradyrhizobium jicamae]